MNNRNVAVFIDAENLFKGYGKLDIPDVSMADILKQLEDAASREAGAGSIAVARAYADWNALGLEDYRRDVERAGVQTVQVFSAGKASKNAADIELVIDCLRSASDLDQLEVFIIVSADGDFVPLVRRLHELDKYVVGATLVDHPVNSLLQREVDQYVGLKIGQATPSADLHPVFSAADQTEPSKTKKPEKKAEKKPEKKAEEKVEKKAEEKVEKKAEEKVEKKAEKKVEKKAEKKVEKKAGKAGKAEPAKKQAKAQPEKQAEAEPAKKQAKTQPAAKKQSAPAAAPPKKSAGKTNWHELAKEIPVVHPGPATSPADYKTAIKSVLLDRKVRSFCDQLANHGGTLPILAMAIKAAAPQLSPSDARVSSLSRALRFAFAGTQYALARESDDVQPVIVRRADDPPGMLPDLSLDDIERGVQ